MNDAIDLRNLHLALDDLDLYRMNDGWLDNLGAEAPNVMLALGEVATTLKGGDAQHEAHRIFMELQPTWGEEIAQGMADWIAILLDLTLISY